MPAFRAETVVDPLDFDFRPYADASGVIREPNDERIAAFLTGYKELTQEIKAKLPEKSRLSAMTELEIMDAMDELDPAIMVSMSRKLAELAAALCSGFPSEAQILAVPPRIRSLFFNWLQEEVMSPEAVTDGGRAQANGRKR